MSVMLDRQKYDMLVMARLATDTKSRLTVGILRKALQPYVEQHLSTAEQRSYLAQSIVRLDARGDIVAKPLGLTDAGRARLRSFWGAKKTVTWQTLKKYYMTPKALALEPTDKVRKRIADKNGLRASILWRNHQLPQPAPPTLLQAVDALVWNELGIDEDGPLSLNKLRVHVLHRMLGTQRALSRNKLEQMAAARAVGSDGLKPDHLRLALVQTWLFQRDASSAPETMPVTTPIALAQFARDVLEIAGGVHDDGRFGDRKVFISAIWDQIQHRTMYDSLTLASFKGYLLRANQADLLRLHRADLVPVMPMAHVLASETTYMNATFHFVESLPVRSSV